MLLPGKRKKPKVAVAYDAVRAAKESVESRKSHKAALALQDAQAAHKVETELRVIDGGKR